MSKKRGAPKKAANERKASVTQIRLQPSEKEGFAEAAQLAGLSLSAWMRERLRIAAKKELEQFGKTAVFLRT
jgi:predicted HicB family RNase H-like nuclease